MFGRKNVRLYIKFGRKNVILYKYSRLEEDLEECEHPSYFLDESDDCYLVYTLGEAGSHFHPVCYKAFQHTHPVPKKIAAQLKAHLEEVEKC